MRRPSLFGAACGALLVTLVYADVRLYQLGVDHVGEYSPTVVAHRVMADACQVILASLFVACGLRRIRHGRAAPQSAVLSIAGLAFAGFFAWKCTSSHLRTSNLAERYAHPMDGVILEDRFIAIVEDPEVPMPIRSDMAKMHADSIYTYTGYKAPVVTADGDLIIFEPRSKFSRDEWVRVTSEFSSAVSYNTARSLVALPVYAASIMFGLVAPMSQGRRPGHP